MTFVGDPPATPRRTPGWPVSNGCVTAVKTLFTPISHKYSTDLRIYGFTDLPPSLPLFSGTPVTRICESSYRRKASQSSEATHP